MTKNGKRSERKKATYHKQVFRPMEASDSTRSNFDVSEPVKISKKIIKGNAPGMAEVNAMDPEEEIVWNGTGIGPSMSHRNFSASAEAAHAACSVQHRSDAKWVPLPAQTQTAAHQYSELKNLLERNSNQLLGTAGRQPGSNPKFRKSQPSKKSYAQNKGGRSVHADSTGYMYVEKFSSEKEREAAVVVDANSKKKGAGSAVGGLPMRDTRKKDILLFWIACQGNEGEITVSQPFSSQDHPQVIDVGRTDSVISVSNNGKKVIKLEAVKLVYANPKDSFSLTLGSDAQLSTDISSRASQLPGSLLGPYSLLPGNCLSFQLACIAQLVGYHKAIVLFDFGRHKVLRVANLIAEDDIARALHVAEPYSRATVKSFPTRGRLIRGPPPPAPRFAKPLAAYQIPRDIERALVKDQMLPVFSHGLTFGSYQEYFSSLIYAEELKWKADIHVYDLQNVTMRLDKAGFLALRVPGLLERRPSIIYRDTILVKPLGSDKKYQGFVYGVLAEEVLLKFHASFHKTFITNQKFDVRFSYSRVTLRRYHQAIHASKSLENSFLFPPLNQPASISLMDDFTPVNRMLNEEQKKSVLEILKRMGGPPYLVYGPPGTGKTVTVVEAILQALKSKVDSKILACAPSNAAADVLLDRLRGYIQVMDLLRLNAYTRPLDDLAPELWPYCSSDGSFFCCPNQDKLFKYKVVVSTYLSAAMLEAQGIERGHFSHIFLDECGQGIEPEAMVALSSFVRQDTVVVLAGDHQQLGPIVRSPIAQKFGLGVSLLERLSNLPLYSRSPGEGSAVVFNKAAVTKLVRNYRSHPAILDLPSRLFYDGELIASAPPEMCNSLCGWEELPNKNFPLLFVGVEGKDEREGKSPSWFNSQEASKVVEIVGKLKECRRNRLSDNDIGVISPYNQQVKKIKRALALKNMTGIKIGSVEQFQGQERKVIIVSTVRSSQEFVESDKLHQIGFLKNPKRFNVAITRAKALLVIIGNPYVLSQDHHWGELLQYCVSHKSYVGCTPPAEHSAESKELNEYLEKFSAAAQRSAQDGDSTSADDSAAAGFETPWADATC